MFPEFHAVARQGSLLTRPNAHTTAVAIRATAIARDQPDLMRRPAGPPKPVLADVTTGSSRDGRITSATVPPFRLTSESAFGQSAPDQSAAAVDWPGSGCQVSRE